MTPDELAVILKKHRKWLNNEEGGDRANLQGANLDYSCWPLWCGSLGVKTDRRVAAQLAYHFCRLDCDDPEYLAAISALLPFANTFHRVDECGRLTE